MSYFNAADWSCGKRTRRRAGQQRKLSDPKTGQLASFFTHNQKASVEVQHPYLMNTGAPPFWALVTMLELVEGLKLVLSGLVELLT